jgi:hypothetical protein
MIDINSITRNPSKIFMAGFTEAYPSSKARSGLLLGARATYLSALKKHNRPQKLVSLSSCEEAKIFELSTEYKETHSAKILSQKPNSKQETAKVPS